MTYDHVPLALGRHVPRTSSEAWVEVFEAQSTSSPTLLSQKPGSPLLKSLIREISISMWLAWPASAFRRPLAESVPARNLKSLGIGLSPKGCATAGLLRSMGGFESAAPGRHS